MRDIARRIMTAEERRNLPADNPDARQELVLLFFALKEAVYKAIDPFVHRHVRFLEVELRERGNLLSDAGEMDVILHLPEFTRHTPQLKTRWWREGDWLMAVAGAERFDREPRG